ncbi:LacI family DNA-binding transcriptional regulator [Atopococcus tabaci]|uniref:LacI family DNA-binding transcriptional regulator n=1 Tax=Atopococcus tabaci TaxID=269774 RepID=UPI000407F4B8|nr:LacI family DNA-binding transcriptional regulator [Atopococcus tabaci]
MHEKKKITIKDIAKAAEVSETTVSRFLNAKYEYMSEETKKRIEEVVEELNYRPSNIARSLKSKRSFLIGAVIADIENPFSNMIIKGLSDQADKMGFSMMIAVSDNTPRNEQEHIQRFVDNGVDALVVNTVGNNDEYLLNLHRSGLPVILLDRAIEKDELDLVTSNGYELASEAMDHLHSQGYAFVGYFTEEMANNSQRQKRHQAFEDKLDALGMDGETYVVDIHNLKTLQGQLEDFEQREGPKALFAANGLVLLEVLKGMKELSIADYDEIGICGFDDLAWASLIRDGITTIRQDSYSIGQEACRLTVKRVLEEKGRTSRNYVELPGELIVRGSTMRKNNQL